LGGGSSLIQLFPAGILNVRAVLMIGMMEQHFIEASPIKYLVTFCALGEVLFFFRRQLFVLLDCHPSFRISGLAPAISRRLSIDHAFFLSS
jgi:hypothetical protein